LKAPLLPERIVPSEGQDRPHLIERSRIRRPGRRRTTIIVA
jgi:hypothetical protein